MLYITAAAQFFDRWKMKKPKQPSSEEDSATREDDIQTGSMPTKVFWALATIVFDTGNRRWDELNKRSDYRKQMKPFIKALELALEFEAENHIQWEDGDSSDRGEMTSFLILSHKSLPPGFSDVMRTASDKQVFDLDEMMEWSGHWLVSPVSNEWINTKDEYLDMLKELCNNNRPGGNTNDTKK
jgi:hypothetical protein